MARDLSSRDTPAIHIARRFAAPFFFFCNVNEDKKNYWDAPLSLFIFIKMSQKAPLKIFWTSWGSGPVEGRSNSKTSPFARIPTHVAKIQKCCCDNAAQSRQVYIQERSMMCSLPLLSGSLERSVLVVDPRTDRRCSSSLSSSLSSSSWVLRLPPQAICLPPSFLRRSAPTARRGTSGRRAGERSPRGPSL